MDGLRRLRKIRRRRRLCKQIYRFEKSCSGKASHTSGQHGACAAVQLRALIVSKIGPVYMLPAFSGRKFQRRSWRVSLMTARYWLSRLHPAGHRCRVYLEAADDIAAADGSLKNRSSSMAPRRRCYFISTIVRSAINMRRNQRIRTEYEPKVHILYCSDRR
jgi:hypothetical protein